MDFLKEIEKSKLVERKVYRSKQDRFESDAEHAWQVAMFVILFRKEFPYKLDLKKC